jgi:hypothetical protein
VESATLDWVSHASTQVGTLWPVPYDPVWFVALVLSGAVVFAYARRQKEVLL